jgi:hypothetical protein
LFLSFWQSEYAIVETTNSQMELSQQIPVKPEEASSGDVDGKNDARLHKHKGEHHVAGTALS